MTNTVANLDFTCVWQEKSRGEGLDTQVLQQGCAAAQVCSCSDLMDCTPTRTQASTVLHKEKAGRVGRGAGGR